MKIRATIASFAFLCVLASTAVRVYASSPGAWKAHYRDVRAKCTAALRKSGGQQKESLSFDAYSQFTDRGIAMILFKQTYTPSWSKEPISERYFCLYNLTKQTAEVAPLSAFGN